MGATGRYSCGALLIILLAITCAKGQVFDRVVDPSGNGNYRTIREAIQSVPSGSPARTLIFIREGVYQEKIVIPPDKANLSLIGEGAEKVVISWEDYSGKNGLSTANSYTVWADGNGLYAENLTIRNTAGPVGQAVALRTTGDTMVFKNCTFSGFQDTYYAHKKRQYHYKCRIEGATDFIFGDATAVFDSCRVVCLQGGQYITAPADAKTVTSVPGGSVLHGLLFRRCQVTSASGVGASSYFLGRPWQPAASSVFIGCTLGPHIRPEGWSAWSGNNHLTSFFAEYKSRDGQGAPADVSRRVAWSYQLDQQAAESYYNLPFFFRKDGKTWDPERIVKDLPSPPSLRLSGKELQWEAVGNSIGYVIDTESGLLGYTRGTSFLPDTLPAGGAVRVRAVSHYGAVGLPAFFMLPTGPGVTGRPEKTSLMAVEGTLVNFTGQVSFALYTVRGELAASGNCRSVDLKGYKPGVYLIRATTGHGRTETKKIQL